MGLFAHPREPRLVRFTARREAGSIVFVWDARGGHALLWRVLRSEHGFAEGAFDHTAPTGKRDDAADRAATYCHTVFAENERGEWHRLAKVRLALDDGHLEAHAEGDFEAGGSPPGSVNPHAVDVAKWGTPR
jgi:hypothetical protein